MSVAFGIQLIQWISRVTTRDGRYKYFLLLLTFFMYTSFHLSRKPISVVKNELHKNCTANQSSHDSAACGWAPFNGPDASLLLGSLDYAYLGSYAIGMFISGQVAERMNLRYFLSGGMLLSGIFTVAFGFTYFFNIHLLVYMLIIQIIGGFFQASGWPGVVACVGNWFGKGKRGLVMGIWNSHTSVGNILGSVIAGIFVDHAWGWSFVVPGLIISGMGIITFFFLVPFPEDINCTPPEHNIICEVEESTSQCEENQDNDSLPVSKEEPDGGPIHSKSVSETPAIGLLGALKIPGVLEFSFCLFFVKLVSYTFLFWLPKYINHQTHYSSQKAANFSTIFDVGGIVGSIVAGLISDYAGERAITCNVMLLVAAPLLYLYNREGSVNIYLNIGMLFLCGVMVNGPYGLITTAVSADLGTHKSLEGNSRALATVTAVIDGTGSIGAALGPLIAGIVVKHGWNYVFYVLIASDLMACLLLTRLVLKEIQNMMHSHHRHSYQQVPSSLNSENI